MSDPHVFETITEHVDEVARDLLARYRTVAVVGFSATPGKESHDAPMELVRRGWHVIPVNPNAAEIDGIPTVPDLAGIDEPVDIVDVFRPAPETPSIAEQAVAIGAKAVWLQLGIVSHESRSIAEAAGLDYVEDVCVAQIAHRFDLAPPA